MRRYLIALSSAGALLALGATAAQAAPARTAGGVGGVPTPAGVVSARPATNTPHLKATADQPPQQIRQLVQCGGTMYAVGTFSEILKGSTVYRRTDIFSFKATSPYTMTRWAPKVVGSTGTTANGSDAIDSIAFDGGNCGHAYIGGKFTSVNGTHVKNIAEISTSTGRVRTRFGHNASGTVQTLRVVGKHLLAGGAFTSINDSRADAYLASLSPVTGRNDGFVHLGIRGNYRFRGVQSNSTRVYNQALSHSLRLDLVMGDFTTAGGRPRQQIFMLNVTGRSAKVTGWTSPEFSSPCNTTEPFYVRAASWSARDSEIYIGTTGYHPFNKPIGRYPRTGLCDAAAAFPAAQRPVHHSWVNYTGCDSLYATAADSRAAYFAGHERWSMNPRGCDFRGPGAYPAPGMEGLSPRTGAVYVNSTRTAGHYSRARGLGADDMLLTRAGLWVASDNAFGSQSCGGVMNLSGICFLPYPHR